MTASFSELEVANMRLAVEQGRKAFDVREVPVGCVFIHKPTGTVLAGAHNETNLTLNATRHAEFVAIDKILASPENKAGASIFAECELYVTVEPCVMCAAALRMLKIGKVYYGCGNDRFGGAGSIYNLHSDSGAFGFPCVSGLMKEEAIDLLREFYARGNPTAPPEKRARELKTADGDDSAHASSSRRNTAAATPAEQPKKSFRKKELTKRQRKELARQKAAEEKAAATEGTQPMETGPDGPEAEGKRKPEGGLVPSSGTSGHGGSPLSTEVQDQSAPPQTSPSCDEEPKPAQPKRPRLDPASQSSQP